ncbi:MAG: ABC transporter ATP-binding protein [Rhizobiaceae bacterium]|nr:ABC transporter ATP-binding protein [Rhizobiaceae bacterium]
MTAALQTIGLAKNFGALNVTRNVSLDFERGARTALIGPNGAGKTTLVNLITGALDASAGQVFLDGHEISGLSQAARARRGLVRTFQISRLFRPLTVEDNIRLACIQRLGLQSSIILSGSEKADLGDAVASVMDLTGLSDSARMTVSSLAYGEQRLVELALALALRPNVLLLDEPAAGVPQSESHIIMDAIASLPSELAVVFIEHDMDLVFRFAKKIVVLVDGAVLVEGTPDAIASHEEVKRIYFGEARP